MMTALRKWFPVFMLISASVKGAFASDVVFNNPDNAGHWGVRASLDVSNPGDWKSSIIKVNMFESRLGASAGAYYHLPLVANLYFEPGASLFYDTYKMDFAIDESNNIASGHIDKFGIRVPLDFGFHFDIWENASLYIKTGPQLMYGFTEKMHIPIEEEFDNDMYGEDGMLNRFDLLWDIAAGADFGRWNVALGYDFGLLNLAKNTGGRISYHENYFRISVGFAF